MSDTRTVPRVLDSDKAKLFCTREEIKQWRREHGSCVDYLDYCTQVLASRSTDAGHVAGDDGVGDDGGDAGLGLDATAPPFIPAASEDSEVPRRKDRGESPARGDAATSLEGAAKQAGLRGGAVRWQAGVLRCCWTTHTDKAPNYKFILALVEAGLKNTSFSWRVGYVAGT